MSELTATQIEKLEAIRYYHTKYEVILTDGESSYLVRYTPRKSKQGIRGIGSDVLTAAMSIAGVQDFSPTTGQHGFKSLSTNWKIIFSGRTQREAIIEGEYPFVISK